LFQRLIDSFGHHDLRVHHAVMFGKTNQLLFGETVEQRADHAVMRVVDGRNLLLINNKQTELSGRARGGPGRRQTEPGAGPSRAGGRGSNENKLNII